MSHEQHDDPISTDFAKLQQQLKSAQAANAVKVYKAVLKHSTKMEQMRHELEKRQVREDLFPTSIV